MRDALTEAETRPRTLRLEEGLLVILRGINEAEGADPADMVSLRLYVDDARTVTLSRRPLRQVEKLAHSVREGHGPEVSGAWLAELVERMTDLLETHVAGLEDRTDTLESRTIIDPRAPLRPELVDQRLELTDLRRFLVPQRDAVRGTIRVRPSWLSEPDRRKLAEQHDQLTRATETLEATREQLQTIRDEIEGARAERLNRNLYVLSVISAVLFPLGFLTGLMGSISQECRVPPGHPPSGSSRSYFSVSRPSCSRSCGCFASSDSTGTNKTPPPLGDGAFRFSL